MMDPLELQATNRNPMMECIFFSGDKLFVRLFICIYCRIILDVVKLAEILLKFRCMIDQCNDGKFFVFIFYFIQWIVLRLFG